MSARELLLAAVSFQNITPVELKEFPELDGKIFVRVMTAGERQMYLDAALQAQSQNSRISDYEIVAICACEADGKPMFHDRQPDGRLKVSSDDVASLVNVDGRAISAIASKALDISGLIDPKEKAKKDSASSQSDASSSGSQDSSAEA